MDAQASLAALDPLIEIAAHATTAADAANAALDALAMLGVRRAWMQHLDAAGVARVLASRGASAASVAAAERGLPAASREAGYRELPTDGAPAGSLLADLRADGVAQATFVELEWRGASIGMLVLLDEVAVSRPEPARRVLRSIALLAGIICGRERVIHARRRLEQELLHAQRLESVGRVAGGIAHDFNNMLTAMIGYMDLAAAGLPPDAEEQGFLAQALDAADQAALLTRQMLAFARRQPGPPTALDLSGVLGRMAPLVRRLMPETIEVNVDATTAGCRIVADPGQLEQLIVNFAFRARDAMVAGGVLTLATRLVEGEGGGTWVALEASDNGAAIGEEALRIAIEPFRGPPAEGGMHALALAIAAALVRDSGGSVEAVSDPANGTRVRALWPLAAAPEAVARRADRRAGGGETVLFVEDDASVRGLATAMLTRLGYVVLAAADADEALRRLEEHPGAVHLLLADLVMPGMGGRDLAVCARARRPELGVLLTSGYSATPDTSDLAGGFAFLAKPFTHEALSRRVREVLDALPARGGAPVS